MVDVTQGTMTTENTAPRFLGFDPESTVDVRQFDDRTWTILRPLTYHAKLEDFEVPAEGRTDFASVPRAFVWFLPRYGRYTKAAILHDYLWGVAVPVGRLTRLDADGIFRTAMRELGVPFLRRWIMWAAVRWGALTKADGRQGWWREAWRVALVTALALPIVAPAAAVILMTLPAFYVLELLVWLPLQATRTLRMRRGHQAKKVNQPVLRWNL
jgi:hypothetical protein